jgi:hypothetical protein
MVEEPMKSEAAAAEANSVRIIKWKGKKNIIRLHVP